MMMMMDGCYGWVRWMGAMDGDQSDAHHRRADAVADARIV